MSRQRMGLAVALTVIVASSAGAQNPGAGAKIAGFNFATWSQEGYASPAAEGAIKEIAQTGARWAALTPTWYVERPNSSRIARAPQTPSDSSLRSAIRSAKAAGLKVAVKPHVDSLDGTYRSELDPEDFKAWWEDFRGMTLHYARLAAEEKAEMFVAGTELAKLDRWENRTDWERLIRETRAVYPGPLTYAANWYNAPLVSFWEAVDYVGIDAYLPVPPGVSHPKALKAALWPYAATAAVLARKTGKPLLFTEFGIASQKGAQTKPWAYSDFGPVDLEIQRDYLHAFLETFQDKPYVAGFWHWAWDLEERGPNDKSHSVRGKPALETLSRYFRTGRVQEPARPDLGPAGERVKQAARAPDW